MATTPLQPWSSLTLDQKVQYAKNVSMANNGVSQPNTTAVNATNLNKLITATQADIMAIKSLLTASTLASTGTSAYTTPIPFTSLPTQLQTKLLQFVPPGYSPPTIISGQEVVNIEQGVVNSLQALQIAQSTLPKAGAGTSVQPLQPAAPVATQPNNTLSTIATVAAVIGGGALIVNALNNRVQNPAPPSTNNQANPAVAPAPNNTPLVTSSTPALVNQPGVIADDATGVDAAVERQKQIEDGSLEFAGIDEQIANNENGLQEPPLLTDEEVNQQIEDTIAEQKFEDSFVDDATGVDAAVAQQKFEDSFVDDATGVDEQVAEKKTINENTTGQAVVAEDGTVNPNIKINPETGELYVPVGDAGIDDQIRKQAEERRVESTNPNQGGASSNKTALRNTQAAQTEQTAQKFKAQEDWRVRLSLAPGSTYLYKVGQGAAGILNPLQATDGVIFPYTPAISVVYSAGYDSTDVTHSNYKFFSYKNSNVDNVTITADFTAQDTAEAQYLLAVIHFFRSVTKMFYGKDPGPGPGVPPPLCYLNGLGSFQFDWHPLVINNFTYTLPTDVDYIRAMDTASRPGVNVGSGKPKGKPNEDPTMQRMAGGGIQTGALAAPPQFKSDSGNKDAVTYVPTKMSITIQAYPIVSRNDVSNNFSLKEYATGKLLRGSQRQSGGFW